MKKIILLIISIMTGGFGLGAGNQNTGPAQAQPAQPGNSIPAKNSKIDMAKLADDDIAKGNKEFFDALGELIKSGCVVGMTTQCINGRVNMNVYSSGRKMQDIGILGNYSDMLTETAFIKLAWLLSNFKKEDVRSLIGENLDSIYVINTT